MARLTCAVVLAYPLVLHVCVSTQRLSVASYYLAGMLLLPLVNGMVSQRRVSVFEVASGAFSVILLTALNSHELLVFKLLPVTAHVVLFGLFAVSLQQGATPVITRLAAAMRSELSTEEVVYTRGVTIAWTAFFLVMAILSGGLAFFSSDTTWSWFVNVISYALVALFFVLEFRVRQLILGSRVDYGFVDFLLQLMRIDVHKLFRRR